MHMFSRHRTHTHEAMRWMTECVTKIKMENLRGLEGYDDLVELLLSQLTPEGVMLHYKPEARLAGLAPEARLAGLAPEALLQLLRHLGKRAEGKLPAELLEALRKSIDGLP
jgi:predicted component of type VI protein secretion system